MNKKLLKLLICPFCQNNKLSCEPITSLNNQEISEGIVYCRACLHWYPVINGLLELLEPPVGYPKTRQSFWKKNKNHFLGLGLKTNKLRTANKTSMEKKQQKHFDQYAQNTDQTYSALEKQPLWQAVDKTAFDSFLAKIKPKTSLLDIGCAQGRSIKNFVDLPITIVAFDISKKLVEQAVKRYSQKNHKAKVYFFVGNGSGILPFEEKSFDYVLVYGVLHHLPNPKKTCLEIARILKPNGWYFGNENNASIFRPLFNFMQKIKPLWKEKAGQKSVFSPTTIRNYFKPSTVRIKTKTIVFIPPFLINLMSLQLAKTTIFITNKIFGFLPIINQNGGLIHIEGQKKKLRFSPEIRFSQKCLADNSKAKSYLLQAPKLYYPYPLSKIESVFHQSILNPNHPCPL